MALSLFDETIFRHGELFSKQTVVNVFNPIDEFLVQRLNLVAGSQCNVYLEPSSCALTSKKQRTPTPPPQDVPARCRRAKGSEQEQQQNQASKSINLNPRTPCMGLNVFTMIPSNLKLGKLMPFNQIHVVEDDDFSNVTPLSIGDHVPDQVYSVGSLTAFESALLLKYYAINWPNVMITRHLYNYVKHVLRDHRAWFNQNSNVVSYNNQKELIYNDEIVNLPNLSLSGPAITLQ